eukprot:88107-Rhodomonas_salina.1
MRFLGCDFGVTEELRQSLRMSGPTISSTAPGVGHLQKLAAPFSVLAEPPRPRARSFAAQPRPTRTPLPTHTPPKLQLTCSVRVAMQATWRGSLGSQVAAPLLLIL